MQQIVFPHGWEHHAAPVATLLHPLGPAVWWWLAAALLVASALLCVHRRPALAVFLAAATALALAVSADGLVDDAYIQFRYAANLAAGNGPVFNAGERIEGASGGLWIAVIAAAGGLTGLGPAVAGRLLGLAIAPLIVFLAGATGARLSPGAGGIMAIAWATLPTASLYAATGLETGAFAAALWLLAWGLAADKRLPAAGGAALAAALRPEAVVLIVLVLPFWRRLSGTGRAAATAGLAAVLAITSARLLYYGSPLPNSALVKGVTGAAGVFRGLRYVGNGLTEWWPLLLGLPVLVGRHRAMAPALLPAGVWLLLVAARGGDWMPASRYLLPELVLLVLAVGLSPRRLRLAAVLLLAGVSLIRLAPVERPGAFLPGDLWRAMAEHRVQSRWWEALGGWFGEALPEGTLIATGPSGAIPYASGLPTFDLYGLSSVVTRVRGGAPGHTLWGLPEAIAAGSVVVYPGTPVPQTEGREAVLAVASAQASQLPILADRYRSVVLEHPPEYRLDLLQDLLWVRAGRAIPSPPGRREPPSTPR